MDYINKIIQGDCLELLRNIPDNSIDTSFADPPFNLKKKYSNYKDNRDFQDYLSWCKLWLKEVVRITKPSGSILVHNIPKWLTYYATFLNDIADFKDWIVWDAATAPMGKILQPAHYGILMYSKDSKHLKFNEIRHPHKRCRKCGFLIKDYGGKKSGLHPFGPLVSDVWSDIHRIKHRKNRDLGHPCQLPIHLLERVILMTTDEGGIVLDPFVGTGTTCIAAKKLGRNYIGFDIDEKYVEISKKHLENVHEQSKIDDIYVGYFLKNIITIRDKDWKELSGKFNIPNPISKIDCCKISYCGDDCFCNNL